MGTAPTAARGARPATCLQRQPSPRLPTDRGCAVPLLGASCAAFFRVDMHPVWRRDITVRGTFQSVSGIPRSPRGWVPGFPVRERARQFMWKGDF